MKPLASNTLLQNRYLVVHLIGRGGMGEVYLAIDQRLGNAVALKRTVFFEDETLAGAFEREARILARLRHIVLPKVSDHFLEDGNQCLVMEYIAGDDLAKRLELSNRPFPLEWVAFWADSILDALDYLHTNEPPIVHRDIKPQNLKLTGDNQIILLDFGLSKNTIEATRFSTSAAPSVVGYTPQYAPLEQIRGTGTNARSDIFSLSSTIYQLLTNCVPPDSLTRADVVLSDKPDPLAPIDRLNPQIPPSISEIILKGMEISQDKRFSSAREMQKVLRDAYTPETKNRSSFQTLTALNHSETATTEGQQVSLKTNVVSVPNAESRQTRALENYNSNAAPLRPSESSIADFSASENSQSTSFTTSIPALSQPEIYTDAPSIRAEVAAANKADKKSPLIFAGIAAIIMAMAAIGFGFYVFNNQTAKNTRAIENQTASPPSDAASTSAEAARPAETNLNLSEPTAAKSNADDERRAGNAAENFGNPKTVQPPPVKINTKAAQQQTSELKPAKPIFKPTAKTAPTQLPRILP